MSWGRNASEWGARVKHTQFLTGINKLFSIIEGNGFCKLSSNPS